MVRTIHITLLLISIATLTSYSQVTIPSFIPNSAAAFYINKVIVQGNKKTKDYIITRDITFKAGDSATPAQLQALLDRSQKNIFNTALFTEVKIDARKNIDNEQLLTVYIIVKERWYIFPVPVFELYDRNYKEWFKVYRADLNRVRYGVKFTHYNFSGRRDQLRINIVNGFSKELSFSYNQPYADKSLNHGFAVTGAYYNRIGVSYIDSLNAGLPRQLCSSCPKPDFKLFRQQDYVLSLGYSYRKGAYARHNVALTYINSKVADTVVLLNKNYFNLGNTKAQFADVSYEYNYSKMDYFAYPLIGNAYRLGARYRLGNSHLTQLQLYGSLSTYYPIASKLYGSNQLSASVRTAKSQQSFYNTRTSNLGVAAIRGLEQYTIYSTWDVSLRNSVRYQIINRDFKLPFSIINHEKIPIKAYFRTFADVAYAYLNNPNSSRLNNQWLRTYGIGLDIVTLYDYTIKMDISYNQFKQVGVYFK